MVTVNDFLLEDSVSVAETVAPSRIVEGSQAVEEACGESSQATIAKTCIMLLADDVFDSEAKLRETIYVAAGLARLYK